MRTPAISSICRRSRRVTRVSCINSCARARTASSWRAGVSPEGENSTTPASICCLRPATRTMKNSPMLALTIERNRKRSRRGLAGSCASSSTRRKNSRSPSSRSMNSPGSFRSDLWSAIRAITVPRERDVKGKNLPEEIVLFSQRPLFQENVVGTVRPYLHLRPFLDHHDALDLLPVLLVQRICNAQEAGKKPDPVPVRERKLRKLMVKGRRGGFAMVAGNAAHDEHFPR